MAIYRLLHPTTEYASFSSSYGTFTKIEHILHHKIHLSKFKRLEIIHQLSDNYGIKLKINNRIITGKFQHTWKLNNRLLNNNVSEESQEKLKNVQNYEYTIYQNL